MKLEIINRQEVLGKDFKIYGDFDNPLFLARDVAEWVDYYKNSEGNYDVIKMIRNVDEDEKLIGKIFLSGQNRKVWFLTEDGLYEVLMQSRKPIARAFKKKVKEILKDLRTGKFRVPQNYVEALHALIDSVEENEKLILENKKLRHEKAWISDRKTATAMNTASQKSKEVKRLKLQLDQTREYATVRRVAKIVGEKIDWRPLMEYCTNNGCKIITAVDELYDRVNSYPAIAWLEVYKIDLKLLFEGDYECLQ